MDTDTNDLPMHVGGAAHGATSCLTVNSAEGSAVEVSIQIPPTCPTKTAASLAAIEFSNPPYYAAVVKERNHLQKALPDTIDLLTRLQRLLTDLNGVHALEFSITPTQKLEHWQVDVASELAQIEVLLAILQGP